MKKIVIISILTIFSLLNISYADSALPPVIEEGTDAEIYLVGLLLVALIVVGILLLINKKKK